LQREEWREPCCHLARIDGAHSDDANEDLNWPNVSIHFCIESENIEPGWSGINKA
jgi:hypothetical protein